MMNRRKLALIVLGAIVLSSLATWFASSKLRSPADIAAEAAAPNASSILAPVEERVLASRVISRGVGHYGSTRELSVARSNLKKGSRVVTHLPRPGALISEGDVLLTISGRPTLLLDGVQPSYRDLGPGMSGTDVLQLEKGLQRLHLNPGRVDGSYDDSTGRAVSALYRRHGFSPVVASAAQIAGTQPRESALIEGSRAQGGTQLPADEVMFVAATPLRINTLATEVGAAPRDPLMTVSDSVAAVDGTVPVDQAQLIKVGTEVSIDEPALGIKTRGTIREVATRPGTGGADQFHVAFQVLVPRPPPTMIGASVRLSIAVTSTKKSTLAVPVSALSLGPDGNSRVERSVGGQVTSVPVETGLSADGFVAVTPTGGQLVRGDLVVVGIASKVG